MIHPSGATTASEMWKQLTGRSLTTAKESKGRLGVLATRSALYRLQGEEGFDMDQHILFRSEGSSRRSCMRWETMCTKCAVQDAAENGKRARAPLTAQSATERAITRDSGDRAASGFTQFEPYPPHAVASSERILNTSRVTKQRSDPPPRHPQ